MSKSRLHTPAIISHIVILHSILTPIGPTLQSGVASDGNVEIVKRKCLFCFLFQIGVDPLLTFFGTGQSGDYNLIKVRTLCYSLCKLENSYRLIQPTRDKIFVAM